MVKKSDIKEGAFAKIYHGSKEESSFDTSTSWIYSIRDTHEQTLVGPRWLNRRPLLK